jgi:hypothetical protein
METKDLMDLGAYRPHGFILHRCAVKACGMVYDMASVEATDPASGRISHGLCPAHQEEAMKEAGRYLAGLKSLMLLLVPSALLWIGGGR